MILSTTRREMMFINMLRGLHPKEAEVVILVKDKVLSSKYKLTQEIVAEAYTDITLGWSFMTVTVETKEEEMGSKSVNPSDPSSYGCQILREYFFRGSE